MKALVTLESGKMFQIDVRTHLLTSMDKLGKPIASRSLQRDPIMVPGCPFAFEDSDGLETTEAKVVHVLYSG